MEDFFFEQIHLISINMFFITMLDHKKKIENFNVNDRMTKGLNICRSDI